MRRALISWLGLAGPVALVSYAAAVALAPLAYPGYDWMAQAVSDLSAESAPSRALWNQPSAPYGVCSVVCATCVAVYVSAMPRRQRRALGGGYRGRYAQFWGGGWLGTQCRERRTKVKGVGV